MYVCGKKEIYRQHLDIFSRIKSNNFEFYCQSQYSARLGENYTSVIAEKKKSVKLL